MFQFFPSRSRTKRRNYLKFLFSHFFVVPQTVLWRPISSYYFFLVKTKKQMKYRSFGWWLKNNFILRIFWNFLTRQKQKFMDYFPLIYNKSLFNMNFQFVCWLLVTTSFSSKWWRCENTTWYILSIFSLISIFCRATMILKNNFVFVKSLQWYEIVIEFLQFWCAKRASQIKNKETLIVIYLQ